MKEGPGVCEGGTRGYAMTRGPQPLPPPCHDYTCPGQQPELLGC